MKSTRKPDAGEFATDDPFVSDDSTASTPTDHPPSPTVNENEYPGELPDRITIPPAVMSLSEAALYNQIGVRTLTNLELATASGLVNRERIKTETWAMGERNKLRRLAQERVTRERKSTEECKRRESAIDKREKDFEREMTRRRKELEKGAPAANEREKQLERQLEIIKAMPENMDASAARDYFEINTRKVTIAGLQAIAEMTTDEGMRFKVYKELAAMDMGRNASLLRGEDADTPGILIMREGEYGIPKLKPAAVAA